MSSTDIHMPETETGPNGHYDPKVAEMAEAAERVNILLVDDRQDKRMAMETIIAELGQNVIQASSGKEALRCILQHEFAVILLDVNMPGMDGFETAFLIRQRRNSEHTPIIFVTALSDTETHASRGYSLGAVDYITTPVMPEVLRTKIWVFAELYKKTERIKKQAERLRVAYDDLEARVKARTNELAAANKSLKQEVAERQAAEDEVRKLNADLEQRVLERTSALAASNSDLEAFTYSVAHDLQAPLRHVQSYAELLLMDYSAQMPADAEKYLKRIVAQGKSMSRMLEDLLKLSLIGKQDLSLQRTRLSEVVDEVLSGIKQETNGRDIEWRVGDLPLVSCDPGLIRLVFVNLLSNAVKYTRPREHAVVEVGQTRTDGQTSIFVRDNGVGFAMEHAGKLFGVFQRLHRATEFEGNGVGLATVSRIVRKHGGRIWAEAAENQGAAFYFTLEGKEGP
jgi:two-component system sensor histidine kinase/response regulator